MRIVTYNLFGFQMLKKYSIEDFAEALKLLKADIFLFQEVDHGRLHGAGRILIKQLAEVAGMNYLYHPIVKMSDDRTFGNAAMSCFPLKLIEEDFLPGKYWRTVIEPRGVMYFEAQANSEKIRVFNTHLSFLGYQQKNQMRALAQDWLAKVKYEECPVILGGDFNLSPKAKYFKLLPNWLSMESLAVKNLTWPSQKPWRQLDHIFMNDFFRTKRFYTPKEEIFKRISDHLPLVADLELKK